MNRPSISTAAENQTDPSTWPLLVLAERRRYTDPFKPHAVWSGDWRLEVRCSPLDGAAHIVAEYHFSDARHIAPVILLTETHTTQHHANIPAMQVAVAQVCGRIAAQKHFSDDCLRWPEIAVEGIRAVRENIVHNRGPRCQTATTS